MLIDVSYFMAGPRQVLNTTLGHDTTGANAFVENYIAEYQEEYLRSVLGAEVAAVAIDHIGNEVADPDSPVESLLSKIRQSFADYVFYQILGHSSTQATMTGLVEIKGANPVKSPLRRQVKVWNRMVNRHNLLAEWVDSGECPVEGVCISEKMLTPINHYNL